MIQAEWLDIRPWTSLSKTGIAIDHVADDYGLLAVDECTFVMVNTAAPGTVDPEIAGFLWCRSEAAALLVYGLVIPDHIADEGWEGPPDSLIGFHPLTYESILENSHRMGLLTQTSASYKILDQGQFMYSSITVIGHREYYFKTPNPLPNEQPIGIQFKLHI
jgi:hypothetical protein